MRQIVTVCAVLLLLGGCSAREAAYEQLAKRGNEHCASDEKKAINAVVDYLNGQLRSGGAKFELEGVRCDP